MHCAPRCAKPDDRPGVFRIGIPSRIAGKQTAVVRGVRAVSRIAVEGDGGCVWIPRLKGVDELRHGRPGRESDPGVSFWGGRQGRSSLSICLRNPDVGYSGIVRVPAQSPIRRQMAGPPSGFHLTKPPRAMLIPTQLHRSEPEAARVLPLLRPFLPWSVRIAHDSPLPSRPCRRGRAACARGGG